MHSPTLKCAVINDFSGYGRCSLSVALPILSVFGVQCCSIPTAILSNHTGYPNYFFDSYTKKMPAYINELKKLNLCFDSIFSGFLGCEEQIDIVKGFINDFKNKNSLVIVDPVMGDGGKIYATYTPEMCKKMKSLSELADIITPNVTEACILADEEYRGEDISDEFALRLVDILSLNKKRSVLITGIVRGESLCTYVFDKDSSNTYVKQNRRIDKVYPGTGDLFAAILSAAVTRGNPLLKATELSADFVEKACEYTSHFDTDLNDGIAFEPLLSELTYTVKSLCT